MSLVLCTICSFFSLVCASWPKASSIIPNFSPEDCPYSLSLFILLFYWKGKPAFKMWKHGRESAVVFSLESFISLIWNICEGRTLIIHNSAVNQSWSNRRLLVHHHLLSLGLLAWAPGFWMCLSFSLLPLGWDWVVGQSEWTSGFPCAQIRHQLFLPGMATCLVTGEKFFIVLKTDLDKGLTEGSCTPSATSKRKISLQHSETFECLLLLW